MTAPNIQSKYLPYPGASNASHTSGGYKMLASVSDATVQSLDCTDFGGRHVTLFAILADVSGDGATLYQYCWATSAEETAGITFATSNTGSGRNPAASTKGFRLLRATQDREEFVDPQRPWLILKALSAPAAAERIVVAVSQPDTLT